MGLVLVIAIIVGAYLLFKNLDSDKDEDLVIETDLTDEEIDEINDAENSGLSVMDRAEGLQRIIDESTALMYTSKNLDVVIRRFETCRLHIVDLEDPEFEIENLDELMDKVRESAIGGVKNALQMGWNTRFWKIEKLKTNKSKANHAIKAIQYFQENIPQIPGELEEGAREMIEQIKDLMSETTARDGDYTQLLRDAEMEIPEWWKKEWKEELPE